MKKRFTLTWLLIVCLLVTTAQNNSSRSVLFLVPFHSEAIDEIDREIKSDADIYTILPFALVGFWKGAQLSLTDLEREEKTLKVIVRDISNDKDKLISILSNEELMHEVSVIIGPFYPETFLLARQYAQKYKIPIINPFTTRQDILADNSYVYKLTPPENARCQDLYERYGRDTNRFRIILWGNHDNPSYKQSLYQDFFQKHGMKIHHVPISADVSTSFASNKENIVMAFSSSTPTILNAIRTLNPQKMKTNTLIIPEEWLTLKEIMPDYFNTLHVHFYSNYFVDYHNDKTQLFISDYIERFNVIPTLDCFSFQGYDITNYFVRKFCFNQDVTDLVPLAYKFNFTQQEGNGYENTKVRFCEVLNFAIAEVKDTAITETNGTSNMPK